MPDWFTIFFGILISILYNSSIEFPTFFIKKPILVSDILPVDVFVPGCPPRPEAIIEAVRLLKFKMQPRPDQTSVLYSALKDNSGQI